MINHHRKILHPDLYLVTLLTSVYIVYSYSFCLCFERVIFICTFLTSSIMCTNFILLHAGGYSIGCPDNSGAAGTLYDAVPRSLFVSNYNLTTDTYTLLLEFPFQPRWTNIYIQDKARATCPLLWSRVQVFRK